MSPMNGGVNRFERYANKNQTIDALDVYAPEGDLQRRPAFRAELIGPQHERGGGATYWGFYDYVAESFTIDFIITFSGSSIGDVSSTKRLLVGSRDKFQGLNFYLAFNSLGVLPTANRFALVRFVTAWNGTDDIDGHEDDFVDVSWLYDSTIIADAEAYSLTSSSRSAVYQHSLAKEGTIAWHESQQPDSWTRVSLDGKELYWVAIDLQDVPVAPGTSGSRSAWAMTQASSQIRNPFSVFSLFPVTDMYAQGSSLPNQLLSVSSPLNSPGSNEAPSDNDSVLVSAYDRGPQLALTSAAADSTKNLGIQQDYGSGVLGAYTDSVYTTSRGPGLGNFEKSDTSYAWFDAVSVGGLRRYLGQFGAPRMIQDLSLDSNGYADNADLPFAYSGAFTGYWLAINDSGSGADGRFYWIAYSKPESNDKTSFVLNGGTAGTPSLANLTVDIYASPCFVRPISPRVLMQHGASSVSRPFTVCYVSDGNTLVMHDGPNTSSAIDSALRFAGTNISGPASVSIEKWTRQVLPQNAAKDAAYYSWEDLFYVAAGDSSLLVFENGTLKEAVADFDRSSPLVLDWLGRKLEPLSGEDESLSTILDAATVLYKKPVQGQFVEVYADRIWVAGGSGNENLVYYSEPQAFSRLWPKINQLQIDDGNGGSIKGLAVLGNELVVYTENAIFSVPPPTTGGTRAFPRSQGIGFVNNKVVKSASFDGSSVLLGANFDGIYAFTGAQPQVILDEWARVLDQPINKGAMEGACAEVSLFEEAYYLAVPVGNSSTNNRVIRYCWADQTMYVWTAPFGGISSMAADRQGGDETLWFGHVDGTISRLVDAETDDGDTITGYARTPRISAGGTSNSVLGLMCSMEETGPGKTITAKVYTNRATNPAAEISESYDFGSAVLGSFALGTHAVADNQIRTRKLNVKLGTVGTSYSVEIRGTSQWRLEDLEILLKGKGQRSGG